MKSAAVALFFGVFLVGCGGSGRDGFDQNQGTSPTDPAAPAPTSSAGFGNPAPAPPSTGGEIHEVFGHSADTLYRLDPTTKAVTVVADFSGCDAVTDIALDKNSNLYATSTTALYTVDRTTAKCKQIATGTYPNSLSFVPKGTVDPGDEALVGYQDSDYLRIDTTTGAITKIGSLGGGFKSSGDIVSVIGGGTYLTVKGQSCTTNDCLVEVDPASGALKTQLGSIGHKSVFGLAFWGGKLYGFDDAGELFEVTLGTTAVTTAPITIPSKPASLSFWGAGSSTSVPLVATPQ